MLRRTVLLLLPVVALLLAAGCSGTDAVDKQGYIKENNEIQTKVQESLSGLSGTSAKDIDAAIATMDAAIEDFESLDVPADYQKEHDQMVASVKDLREVMGELKTAMADKDPTAAAQLTQRAAKAQEQFNEAITAMNADLA